MIRSRSTFFGALLLGFFLFALFYRWLSIPNLKISQIENGALLDFRYLGEYNSWLSEIEIKDQSGRTIWKAMPIPTEKDTVIAIWTMEIHHGFNNYCLGIDQKTCEQIKIWSDRSISVPSGKYQVIIESTEAKLGIMKFGKRWFGKRNEWFSI